MCELKDKAGYGPADWLQDLLEEIDMHEGEVHEEVVDAKGCLQSISDGAARIKERRAQAQRSIKWTSGGEAYAAAKLLGTDPGLLGIAEVKVGTDIHGWYVLISDDQYIYGSQPKVRSDADVDAFYDKMAAEANAS